MAKSSPCVIEPCENPADGGRGWCNKHYLRWRRHGDPLLLSNTDRTIPTVDRWLAFAGAPAGPFGCRLWSGERDEDGYGRFTLPRSDGGGRASAHRWGYEHFVGPIDGETLDHFVCDTAPCVEWTHLRPESRSANTRRARARAQARKAAGLPAFRRPAREVLAQRLIEEGAPDPGGLAGRLLMDLRAEGFRLR